MSTPNRKLSWTEVGISLASIHYGLGFLLGSGAAIHTRGSLGIIYALSSAVGLLTLAIIGPFYWKNKLPIWDLLGEKYGKGTKKVTAFLSGIWMIGVIASQILGGTSAMFVLGVPKIIGSVLITLLILIVSVVDLKKLAKVFSIMLSISSITLLLILISLGIKWIPISLADFVKNIPFINSDELIGIVGTTVLITFIGMDFHQFIVEAKTKKDTILGSLYGGGILILLAMLLLGLVFGAEKSLMVQNIVKGEEIVPNILFNFGNEILNNFGILLSLPILFVSIGSGGGVTRIVAKTIHNIQSKDEGNKKIYNIATVFVSFLLAMSNKSIIDLTVSFYAIYVGSIFVPFAMHLAAEKFKMKAYSSRTMLTSIFLSMIISAAVLIISFVPSMNIVKDTSSAMMIVGFMSSFFVFMIASFKKAFVQAA